MISRALPVLIALALTLSVLPIAPSAPASEPATGAVSGRVYIDFEGNGEYDGVDVPLPNVSVHFSTGETDENGIYMIEGLVPGPTNVRIDPGPCIDYLMNDWLGVNVQGFCPPMITPSVDVDVVAGDTATADIAIDADTGTANGRLWLDGEAAEQGTAVSVEADGVLCSSSETDLTQSAAGVPIAMFSVEVEPTDPDCQGDELSVRAGDRVLYEWTWDKFWQEEWFDWHYRTDFFSRISVAVPSIHGLLGRHQDGEGEPVRAIIDGRLCSEPRPVNNGWFYGLIVPDETARFGCGHEDATITFCVGEDLANETREWREAFGDYVALSAGSEPCPPLQTADADCDGDADAVDALGILRLVAELDPVAECWNPGDVDCDGDRDSVDALTVLRDVASLPYELPAGCNSFVLG